MNGKEVRRKFAEKHDECVNEKWLNIVSGWVQGDMWQ